MKKKKTGCLIIFLLIACFSGRAWCRQVAGPLTRKAVAGRVYKTGKFKAPKPSSAMRTKPDPSRINATPARFFHITDPQIETQAYGHCLAVCQRRDGGFVMAYEAITDRTNCSCPCHATGAAVWCTSISTDSGWEISEYFIKGRPLH